jgi:hypothetical protein
VSGVEFRLAPRRLYGVAAQLFVGVITATLVAPSPGRAQTVDIGGHAGWYHPLGSLIDGPPIEKRLQAALMVGVDAVVWTSGRLGFAGKIAYAPSRVAVIQPGSVTDRNASVILASARVLVAVTPLGIGAGATTPPSPWSVYVGAGAGLASRSGGVWSYASGRTSPALVLSVGVQSAVEAQYTLRFDFEDYISRAQFNAGMPGETMGRLHQDLAFSLSLFYRIRRR